ncbi:MAG: 50S ribosomal protein L25, partial [Nitrosopumilus sp.]|nr:50S ribosomal protein L25 [Nitrosopumilus sp.]
MKSVSIECTPRENVGKSAVKSLRKQEMVPCILYGGKDNIAFAANVKAFKKIVYTPEVFVINLN